MKNKNYKTINLGKIQILISKVRQEIGDKLFFANGYGVSIFYDREEFNKGFEIGILQRPTVDTASVINFDVIDMYRQKSFLQTIHIIMLVSNPFYNNVL